MNNVMTATRMNTLMRCPRQHYWMFEAGLRRTAVSEALQVGSAMARGQHARWLRKSYNEAMELAIPDGVKLDAIVCAKVGALLAGYFKYWGRRETMGTCRPEMTFKFEIEHGFTSEGKVDNLLKSRKTLIESKTTSDSLDIDSTYWSRLRFDLQVLNYVYAARHEGWNVEEVLYDVTHKPGIKPKKVKGEDRVESPEEYGSRLRQDIAERPNFYYVRKEVAVLDDDLRKFQMQRTAMIKMILALREYQGELDDASEAWPRHVDRVICASCQFASFCLQNNSVNLKRPPAGFKVLDNMNPELKEENSHDTSDTITDN